MNKPTSQAAVVLSVSAAILFATFAAADGGDGSAAGERDVAHGEAGCSAISLDPADHTSISSAQFSSNAALNFNKSDVRVSYGNNALTLSRNAAASPPHPYGATLFIANRDGVNNRLVMDGFSSQPVYILRSARGTAASPAALQRGDLLGSLTWWGYGSTGYGTNGQARINSFATEDWSDTSKGADLFLMTTPKGTTQSYYSLMVSDAGKFLLGGPMIIPSAPTYDLEFYPSAGKTLGVARSLAANSAGLPLTLNGGGATSAATNANGGDLVLAAGTATGGGTSKVVIKAAGGGVAGAADTPATTIETISSSGVTVNEGQVFASKSPSTSVPPISFDGDSGTGLSHPATGTLALSTDGMPRAYVDAGNVKIGGAATRTTEGTAQVVLFDGTKPAGTLPHGSSIYSDGGQLKAMDANGAPTVLTPFIGYEAGSGGAATQPTSKTMDVVLNKASGQVTMSDAALAAGTIVSFVLKNSTVSAGDVLVLNHVSGGTPGSYSLNARSAAGQATIDVRNNTNGALAEAIVISYVVIKGSSS